MEYVHLQQRQDRYHNFILLPEVLYQVAKVAERTKQAMEENQGVTLTFLNELELILLFDFVLHVQSIQIPPSLQALTDAKVIVLAQKISYQPCKR
jgi:hypothetical protein